MATTTSRYGDPRRQSYLLSVKPVEMSLTDGTNIPAPSPPRTPPLAELPRSGGGPLSSHPPSTASTVASQNENASAKQQEASANRADGLRSPMSTAQTEPAMSPPQRRRAPSMRRLLSLNNLRASFSGSRTSLLLPRASHDIQSTSGLKRPSSPSLDSETASNGVQPPLRPRRSTGSWFKRRSSIFLSSNHDDYDAEYGQGNKRRKESRIPTLPQISELGGGDMNDGDLGWDDGYFKK